MQHKITLIVTTDERFDPTARRIAEILVKHVPGIVSALDVEVVRIAEHPDSQFAQDETL
jgi:hypothetical protein